ncbi:hypothetical protein HW555_008191, partial [Spodoptera exigua]
RTIIKIREVQGPALVFKAHPYSFTNSEWSQFSSQECTMLNASSRILLFTPIIKCSVKHTAIICSFDCLKEKGAPQSVILKNQRRILSFLKYTSCPHAVPERTKIASTSVTQHRRNARCESIRKFLRCVEGARRFLRCDVASQFCVQAVTARRIPANRMVLAHCGLPQSSVLLEILHMMDVEEVAAKISSKNKHRFWIHPLLVTRHDGKEFNIFISNLKKFEDKFFGYTRMSVKSYEELLTKLYLNIRGQDTRFRMSISPEEKLIITISPIMEVEEAICVYLLLRKKERKKKRQYWVHPILRDRFTHGQFQTLYPKLSSFEPKFFHYLRMSINSFDELLEMMSKQIESNDTHMRSSVSPEEKLVITLRYYYEEKYSTRRKASCKAYNALAACRNAVCRCDRPQYIRSAVTARRIPANRMVLAHCGLPQSSVLLEILHMMDVEEVAAVI